MNQSQTLKPTGNPINRNKIKKHNKILQDAITSVNVSGNPHTIKNPVDISRYRKEN